MSTVISKLRGPDCHLSFFFCCCCEHKCMSCLMVPFRARERCLRFSVHEIYPGQGVMLPHHCWVHRLFNVRISHLHVAHICWTFLGTFRLLDTHSNTITLCCILENIVCAGVFMHVHCMHMCMFEAITVLMVSHFTSTLWQFWGMQCFILMSGLWFHHALGIMLCHFYNSSFT